MVIDLIIALIVLASSHSFFVLKERLFAVLFCFLAAFAFHFLKKNSHKKILVTMGLFFCSYWLLCIPLPYVGYLFWPVDQFIATAILFFVFKASFGSKSKMSWGWRFDKRMLLSLVAIVLSSSMVLVLYFMNHREVANQWRLPDMPVWGIPIAVVLIALINGLREEIYFRFTLQDYLAENASPHLAILCSSIAFGYIHFQGGFPSGGIGVFLTALFGIIIGTQFYYFRSATLSWMTHSITDGIMFAIILCNKI